MTVRAKFRLSLVTPLNDLEGKPLGTRIDMAPAYDSDPESENAKFFKATPYGQITLGTVNPAAAAQFLPGAFDYVDFTPAEA